MKNQSTKKLFLENLKKVPIIQVACEKSGVARATVYRWRKSDKQFSKKLDDALSEGEALVNDMSESQLITLIREKSFSAIRFWLNHRHDKFRDQVKITVQTPKQEELTAEQKLIVDQALQLALLEEKSSTKKK